MVSPLPHRHLSWQSHRSHQSSCCLPPLSSHHVVPTRFKTTPAIRWSMQPPSDGSNLPTTPRPHSSFKPHATFTSLDDQARSGTFQGFTAPHRPALQYDGDVQGPAAAPNPVPRAAADADPDGSRRALRRGRRVGPRRVPRGLPARPQPHPAPEEALQLPRSSSGAGNLREGLNFG